MEASISFNTPLKQGVNEIVCRVLENIHAFAQCSFSSSSSKIEQGDDENEDEDEGHAFHL